MSHGTSRSIATSSAKVLVWSGCALLANGISGVVSARVLSVEDKGVLAMVLAIGGLLLVITSLGTSLAFRTEYPKVPRLVGTRDLLNVSVKLAVPHLVATAIVVGVSQNQVPDLGSRIWFGVLVLLVSTFVFLSNQAIDALHALNRSSEATMVDAIGAVCSALGVLVVSIHPGGVNGLSYITFCYLIGYIARCAVCILRVRAINRRAHIVTRVIKGQSRLIRAGLGFLGYSVGQAAAFRADRYLLGVLSTPTQLGLYSVAATPAELMRLPVSAFGQIMMQQAASHGASRRLVLWSCTVTAAVTAPVALVLLLFTKPIVLLLFGDRYIAAVPVLRVMLLAEILVAFFIILSRQAAGAGQSRQIGIATGAGAAVGLGALLLLAPIWGAYGAAWASVLGYAVMAGGCMIVLLRLPYARRELAKVEATDNKQ